MNRAFLYLKRAFLNHWNLLGLGGATAFSLLSGRPDVFLPLTLAAEVAWLSAVATSPRFHRHVDATESTGAEGDALLGERAQRMLASISLAERRRFERLRQMCREALDVDARAGEVQARQPGRLLELRGENINRLLWILLKLLYSRTALDRFFATTSHAEIIAGADEARRKLAALSASATTTAEASRQRAALEDLIATSELRLRNFQKATDNREFLQIELERLYAKIAGIAEMGINRQDPSGVSGEIDVVSTSALETERAMHEIDGITGLDFPDDRAPRLLAPTAPTSRG